MNDKYLGLIILACLMVEATCGVLDHLLGNRKVANRIVADIKALDEHLAKEVQTNETAVNLEYIKANMATMKGAPLRRAAELVVKVSEMAKQCKQEDLAAFVELSQSDLLKDGKKRVKNVMIGVGLWKAVEQCAQQARGTLANLMEAEAIAGLLHLIRPDQYPERKSRALDNEEHGWVQLQLVNLADNGRSKSKEYDECMGKVTNVPVKAADKYQCALDTHLLKPCRELVSDPRLDLVIDGLEAVRLLEGAGQYFPWLYNYRYGMEWARDTCNDFLKLNAAARAKLFRRWLARS